MAAVLAAGCGAPPAALTASSPGVDASAVVADAGGVEASVEVPAPAPAIDSSVGVGMMGEMEQEVGVDGVVGVEVPMLTDGCVRVVFAAGGPVDVVVGARSVAARTSGVLPENGTVCERAGHPLRLSFTGHANVRYQVFRTRP